MADLTLDRPGTSEGDRLGRLEDAVSRLAAENARLVLQVGRLEDAAAVRKLQHSYGYFMDKGLYNEVVDLFADDGELRFMGGVFKGKEGVRRLYVGRLKPGFTGKNGPAFGMLADHLQLQDVIDVAEDRKTARSRCRGFLQGGSHDLKPDKNPHLPRQWWEAGIYENEYVNDAGVWKVKVMNYNLTWQGDFETGWAHQPPYEGAFWKKTFPEDPLGPDEVTGEQTPFWPDTGVLPFHYPHPVTGKPIQPE